MYKDEGDILYMDEVGCTRMRGMYKDDVLYMDEVGCVRMRGMYCIWMR